MNKLQELKRKIREKNLIDKITNLVDDKIESIEPQREIVKEIKEVVTVEKPIYQEIIRETIKVEKGKNGKDGKDGSPDSPDQIRNKLESLPKGKRLNAKYIDDIEKFAKNIITNIGSSISLTWGKITGDITKQADLIEYIDLHGGGGAVSSVDGQIGNVELSGSYQHLEDQRLSTTDDVEFKSINGGLLSGDNTGDQDLTAINSHLSNTSNPHSVTAEQVGASPTSHNHNLADLAEKSYNSLTDKPTSGDRATPVRNKVEPMITDFTEAVGYSGSSFLNCGWIQVDSNATSTNTAYADHQGVLKCVTKATTGAGVVVTSFGNSPSNKKGFLLQAGDTIEVVARFTVMGSTTRFFIGFIDTANNSAPTVDGAWFNHDGTVITGKCRKSTGTSTTGTSFTPTQSVWYRSKVVFTSSSRIDYYIYDMSGTQLWTDNLQTNIPTGVTGAGINYHTSSTVSQTAEFDYLAYYSTGTLTR